MSNPSIVPILKPYPGEYVHSTIEDGAYWSILGDRAQVIVVGAMHWTPGQYIEALNELKQDGFKLYHNSFMDLPNDPKKHDIVLSRGFVSLMAHR